MQKILLTALTACLLTACAPEESPAAAQDPTQSTRPDSGGKIMLETVPIDWQNCNDKDWFNGDDTPKNLQCATISVPMDAKNPKKQQLTLALTRLPATSAKPIGNLLVIAGGPGDTSLNSVMNSFGDSAVVKKITEKFNVIGYAPRGVAPSTAIDCGEETDDFAQFVRQCQKHSKLLLDFISTRDAVLDVERIRMALNDPNLSIIGYSYGTKVLARYLEKYPDHVRAAVLDGVVDVTEDYFASLAGQEKGFQNTFDRFVKYCDEYEQCILHPKQGNADFIKFLQHIDQQSLTDSEGETITSASVLSEIQNKLLWKSDWDDAIILMHDLKNNDTSSYNRLIYGEKESEDLSAPLSIGAPITSNDVGLAVINCADSSPANKNNYAQKMQTIDNLSPYDNYAPTKPSDYLDACYYWSTGTDSYAAPIVSSKLVQILFVAQTHDPTTPYRNAVAMAKFFRAPLLTRDGDGHTLALTDDSACVDKKVVNYLLNPTKIISSQTCS